MKKLINKMMGMKQMTRFLIGVGCAFAAFILLFQTDTDWAQKTTAAYRTLIGVAVTIGLVGLSMFISLFAQQPSRPNLDR